MRLSVALGLAVIAAQSLVTPSESRAREAVQPAQAKGCRPWRSTPDCRRELAWYFAPVVYQKTDDDRRDFITRFDFDGDYDPANQRASVLDRSRALPAHVYYSVVEGKTHFFVAYAFFHPDDYKPVLGHENDFEGVLLTIERTPQGWGRSLVMETAAHNDFFQYRSDLNILDRDRLPGKGYEDVDAAFSQWTVKDPNNVALAERPEVLIEDKGHGVYANGHQRKIKPGDTHIRYEPAGPGENAQQPKSRHQEGVKYGLIELTGDRLWLDRRASQLFQDAYPQWTGLARAQGKQRWLEAFHGASPPLGKIRANPPWAWDDHDDAAEVVRGDWLIIPAFAMAHHLLIPGLTSAVLNDPHYYDYNPFLEEPPGDGAKANPTFQKDQQPSGATPTATHRQGEETIHLFTADALRKWIPPKRDDWTPEVASGERPQHLRIWGSGQREKGGALALVEGLELWLPLGEINSILLRYANPAGIPAARVRYSIAYGTQGERYPYSTAGDTRLILLPSLTAFPRRSDVPVDIRVDSVRETFLELSAAEPKPFLRSLQIEFTQDLRELGAPAAVTPELPRTVPQLLQEQFRRFLETQPRQRYIDLVAVEVITRGGPRSR